VPLASLTSTLTGWIGDYGLYAIFLLMAVDAVLPAASELVMAYGGALAAGTFAGQHVDLFGSRISTHAAAYVAVALAGAIGYLLGSLVGWAIGRFGGRPLLERRGRWLHLSPERLDRAERWFDRWDDLAVLLGRVTPVVRSFVSIPAGLFGMPLGRYTLLTIPGSAAWSFALAGVGYAAGSGYRRFHEDFRYVDYVVLAAVLLLAVVLFVRWRRSSTLRSRAEDPVR
jgi:membrane protein DedA with SNARE-associated domain